MSRTPHRGRRTGKATYRRERVDHDHHHNHNQDHRCHPNTARRGGCRRTALRDRPPPLQILTRDGFDLRRHPLSMLALGEHGWIQVINFIVAGVLSMIFSSRRRPRAAMTGPAARGHHGCSRSSASGLVIGGVFKADPALGFPAGAPEGYPEQISVHGTIHAFAPPLAFLSVIAACFVHRPPVRSRGDASVLLL